MGEEANRNQQVWFNFTIDDVVGDSEGVLVRPNEAEEVHAPVSPAHGLPPGEVTPLGEPTTGNSGGAQTSGYATSPAIIATSLATPVMSSTPLLASLLSAPGSLVQPVTSGMVPVLCFLLQTVPVLPQAKKHRSGTAHYVTSTQRQKKSMLIPRSCIFWLLRSLRHTERQQQRSGEQQCSKKSMP